MCPTIPRTVGVVNVDDANVGLATHILRPVSWPDDQYEPPQRLRALPSWLAARVARKAERLVSDALAREGLRRQHFTVLASLADQGQASQAELGRRLALDRSDLHAIATELEAAGLIERIRDEHDRRRNVVSLTPSGTATLERLTALIDEAQQALLEPLSAAEAQELVRLLGAIVSA